MRCRNKSSVVAVLYSVVGILGQALDRGAENRFVIGRVVTVDKCLRRFFADGGEVSSFDFEINSCRLAMVFMQFDTVSSFLRVCSKKVL